MLSEIELANWTFCIFLKPSLNAIAVERMKTNQKCLFFILFYFALTYYTISRLTTVLTHRQHLKLLTSQTSLLLLGIILFRIWNIQSKWKVPSPSVLRVRLIMELSYWLLHEQLVKVKTYLVHKVVRKLTSSLHIERNCIHILIGRWIHWIRVGVLALVLVLRVRKLISICLWLWISLSCLRLLLSCIVPLTITVVSWLLLLLIPIGSRVIVIDSIVEHGLGSALGIASDLIIIAIEAET